MGVFSVFVDIGLLYMTAACCIATLTVSGYVWISCSCRLLTLTVAQASLHRIPEHLECRGEVLAVEPFVERCEARVVAQIRI
jgi:hypothetical protein